MTRHELRTVVLASSLGTVFEWYDFLVYGTLAALFGKLFFPSDNSTAGFLLALATFGVGFAVRPLGAVIFGVLGDRIGRKHTFVATITLMGLATAAIGCLPTFDSIGVAAPALLVGLRMLQGLALGGEYGGASIYVAEHAPADRRGALTSFIQAGAPVGLLLSLIVSLTAIAFTGADGWSAWGWRIPFLFSIFLLAISLWMRLKLAESPVFQAMKDAGEIAANPLRESFNSRAKLQRIFAALMLTAGQAVIAYTIFFQAGIFLEKTMQVGLARTRFIVVAATLFAPFLYIGAGRLSDRIGRKKLVVTGFALTALLLFPIFHFIAGEANPALVETLRRSPIVVSGSDCKFNPFAAKGQATACGKVLDGLVKRGVAYTIVDAAGSSPLVTIAGETVDTSNTAQLISRLRAAGYGAEEVTPSTAQMIKIIMALVLLYALLAAAYGPMAAWLVELFPARIRYTSLSIPYHIGSGFAGGFLPFISQYIIAKTGDPFAGFWYATTVVAAALIVTVAMMPDASGRHREAFIQ